MNSTYGKDRHHIFGNPSYFLSKLNDAFYRGVHSSRRAACRPIKFCPLCIREQIKEFGFGYFKSHWLHRDYCLHHNQKLLVADYPLSNIYGYLQKILSGRFPSSSYLSEIGNYQTECMALNIFKKASPCLAEIFKKWIRKNLYLIDEKVAEECGVEDIDRVLSWFFHKDGRVQFMTTRVCLEVVFRAIQKVHINAHSDFIFKHSKTIMIPCGIRSYDSIFVPYLIHREKECTRCLELDCPVSHVISVFRFNPDCSQNETVNLCDQKIRSAYCIYPFFH
ncbi:hypothetical protein AB6E21_10985 [Photobacterium swingsii]|uniref:hypothetical protein n=1 Tax=Photobacterium swingsii TaxID=680026 RepID=UPI0035503804